MEAGAVAASPSFYFLLPLGHTISCVAAGAASGLNSFLHSLLHHPEVQLLQGVVADAEAATAVQEHSLLGACLV